MQHVEVTHRYAHPPQVVWDAYTDHASWSRWAGTPGSKLVREGSPDRNGVGAVRGFAGGVREEVLSFEPPKRMTYTVTAGPMPIRNHLGEVVLEPEEGGTRIVWRCRFESRLPLVGGLVQRFITRFFAGALRGLEKELG